jgi:hypothetical protein
LILQIIGGHQELTALMIRQLVFQAEILGEFCSTLAEIGLETARFIINPCMDDTRIMSGLMPGG